MSFTGASDTFATGFPELLQLLNQGFFASGLGPGGEEAAAGGNSMSGGIGPGADAAKASAATGNGPPAQAFSDRPSVGGSSGGMLSGPGAVSRCFSTLLMAVVAVILILYFSVWLKEFMRRRALLKMIEEDMISIKMFQYYESEDEDDLGDEEAEGDNYDDQASNSHDNFSARDEPDIDDADNNNARARSSLERNTKVPAGVVVVTDMPRNSDFKQLKTSAVNSSPSINSTNSRRFSRVLESHESAIKRRNSSSVLHDSKSK